VSNVGIRRRALLVFAKLPEPGKVKTRLIPALGKDGACSLYQAFLKDSIIQYTRLALEVGYTPYLFVTPSEAVSFFENSCDTLTSEIGTNNAWQVRLQSQGDLGARMKDAFAGLFAQNHDACWIIGTDHPTLPDAYVVDAFRYLDQYDAVIGPADDGGYYGLGLQRRMDFLFEDIPWSTEQVLSTTKLRMQNNRVNYYPIKPWYDVDEPADMYRLKRDLDKAGMRCNYTKQWFEQHGMTYGR